MKGGFYLIKTKHMCIKLPQHVKYFITCEIEKQVNRHDYSV